MKSVIKSIHYDLNKKFKAGGRTPEETNENEDINSGVKPKEGTFIKIFHFNPGPFLQQLPVNPVYLPPLFPFLRSLSLIFPVPFQRLI